MTRTSKKDTGIPTIYNIRVKGHLDPCWSEWLDGVVITPLENGETFLSGPVVDQAALHGLLAKIRDLNLKPISVIRGLERE
jgi:hypothetical protein